MRNFPHISAGEAAKRTASGAVLIDVRSAEEFNTSHLAGSISIPLERIPGEIAAHAKPLQVVLLHCESGERSLSAARVLSRLGYERLFIVD